MAANILHEKTIRAALKGAVDTGKTRTVIDGNGLSLICRPDGAGWWRLRYWIDSRENRLSLGVYPEVSLAEARDRPKAQAVLCHRSSAAPPSGASGRQMSESPLPSMTVRVLPCLQHP